MAKFRLSRRAEADLLSIGEFTLREWGISQAASYLGEIETCCQILADNPSLGRRCDYVRPGLRRHEHGKHVLFYRRDSDGILISRILHQRMLPDRHDLDGLGCDIPGLENRETRGTRLAACPSVDDPNDSSAILRRRPRSGRPISEQIDEVSADNQRPNDCGTFVDGSDMIHRNRDY